MLCGIYQHWKGGFYQCLGIAAHAETDERMVVYVALDAELSGPRLLVRPFALWHDDVVWPDGHTRPRFSYMGTEDGRTRMSKPKKKRPAPPGPTHTVSNTRKEARSKLATAGKSTELRARIHSESKVGMELRKSGNW